MKTLYASVFASLLFASLAAHAGEPTVSVTVSGEITPGVYGEVQIGNAPPPPVVFVKPMIISPRPHHDEDRPIYLNVPPGHARHWARHCREYNACNRPVYFVRTAEYEPGYRGDHDGMRGNGRKDGHRDEGSRGNGKGRGRGNDDHRGEGRD